ncbi:MAG: recombinase family protein, partial [Chloroflexi bacterium]|nr:recombinase family protein [Chloroflexota bacterium]
DEQADKGTVQGQIDFLRDFTNLYGMEVVNEYVDEGYSGTLLLSERPRSAQMLADAEGKSFDTVLVYRLDRLARSLPALIEANTALDQHGVTIRSATEPFDTGSPVGKFVFQLLGSMAELERSTIAERMMMGRDRKTRDGKWLMGPVPFGYDLDDERRLTLSSRIISEVGQTEAEVAKSVFQNIAGGATALSEARRLTALGVPTTHRYPNGTITNRSDQWSPSRISMMVRNSLYGGTHIFKSKSGGHIARDVPPLVKTALWDKAKNQLEMNKKRSSRNSKRDYLLRMLITCDACGAHYSGAAEKTYRFYRCTSQLAGRRLVSGDTCRSRRLPAEWIEDVVWQDCRRFILNPGEALSEAQAQLQKRVDESAGAEGERRRLEKALNDKAGERERMMTLFRRGRATLVDTETQLDAITDEESRLRELLGAVRSQEELTKEFQHRHDEASALLTRLADRLEEIERTKDFETKRKVVELLVSDIHVKTSDAGTKQASVSITYSFDPIQKPVNVESSSQRDR